MFLTNQHFDFNTQDKEKTVAVKDYKNEFTVTSDNLWNNYHRSSGKIYK